MSIRRILLFLALLMVSFGLAACNSAQPDEILPVLQEQPETTTDQDKTYLPLIGGQEASDEDQLPAASEPGAAAEMDDCLQNIAHPIGQNIATTYDVPYQQVMQWYCSGYSFDNILIALETSSATDIPVDTLLTMLLEKEWEEIWSEIGFLPEK